MGLALSPKATLEPFSPSPNDDPFATVKPDYSVGWEWNVGATASIGPRNFGWKVIFDVVDDGATRRVIAKTTGNDGRRTAKKLVQAVFSEL